MDVSTRSIRVEDVESSRECVDIVGREKIYIAAFGAAPLEPMRSFVANQVAQGDPWLAACDGERVVGWCAIQPGREHALRHCGSPALGLLRDHRGKGLARRLLDECLDIAAIAEGSRASTWKYGRQRTRCSCLSGRRLLNRRQETFQDAGLQAIY